MDCSFFAKFRGARLPAQSAPRSKWNMLISVGFMVLPGRCVRSVNICKDLLFVSIETMGYIGEVGNMQYSDVRLCIHLRLHCFFMASFELHILYLIKVNELKYILIIQF